MALAGAQFNAKHKRGNAKNKGQFASKAGGGGGAAPEITVAARQSMMGELHRLKEKSRKGKMSVADAKKFKADAVKLKVGAATGNWDETKHPRGPGGKFAKKAGGTQPSASDKSPMDMTDAELSAAVEHHVGKASAAQRAGDDKTHAEHVDKVEALTQEQDRRAALANPEAAKPKQEQPKAEPEAKPKTADEVRKALPKTLGAASISGFDKPTKPETDKYVGSPVDTKEFDRRVAVIHDDAARMFEQFPKIAAMRDANPLASVEIVATPQTVNPHGGRVVGWHERGDYKFEGGKLIEPDPKEDTIRLSMPMAGEEPLQFGEHGVQGSHISLGQMFRHEYGHHLEQVLAGPRQGEFENIYESKPPEAWAASVSKYGSSSSSELWAESFAAYTHKDYGKPGSPKLPDELHNFWTKHLT